MKLNRYIYILVTTLVLASCGSTGKLDRSMAPAPAEAPVIQIPEYQNFSLENGLQVIVVENHKLPSVSYQLSLDYDAVIEGEKAGYVQMAGDILRKGTTSRTKAEIDEAVDFIGASFSTFSSGMFGRSLTKHSEELLSMMNDVLMNPTFPEEELEKAKTQTLSGLASAKTEPNSMLSNVSGVVNYGKNHPYGEVVTEKTVENITRDDLVSFYNSYWKPNYSYLVIVGDITLDQAKANAEKYFGAWQKGELPNPKFKAHTTPERNKVVFVPLKGAVQSAISVTYPVDLKPGAPDALAARVMNSILGGGVFSGRLMQNLREDKGYTYGARSSLSSDRVVGSFSAGASVRNEVTDSAVHEIIYELHQMLEQPVTDSTLTFVKNSMSGGFARSLENPRTVARFALNTFRYNLPKDYYNTYLQRLSALTPEDVMAAAKKYIRPENCNIVVVGNESEAEKLLRFSGDENVWKLDQYGEEWKDMEAAPEGMTAADVINAYAEAIGGKDALNEIKSFSQEGTMNMMGQEFPIKINAEAGGRFKMVMGQAPMILSEVKFDGKNGTMTQMGAGTQEMDDAMKADFRMQSFPFPELIYAEEGYTLTLEGIGEVEGQRAYVLTVIDSAGEESTEYYSVETGLKIKSESINSHPQMGEYTSATIVNEYMTIEGIKTPSEMTQMEGPQQFKITVTSIQFNPKLTDADF